MIWSKTLNKWRHLMLSNMQACVYFCIQKAAFWFSLVRLGCIHIWASKVWYPMPVYPTPCTWLVYVKSDIQCLYSVYPSLMYLVSKAWYPRLGICMPGKSERSGARAGWSRILVGSATAHWSNKPSRRLADLEIGPPQSVQNHTLLNLSCKRLMSAGQLFSET